MPITTPLYNKRNQLQEGQEKLQSLQSQQFQVNPNSDMSISTQMGMQDSMSNAALSGLQQYDVDRLKKDVEDELFNLLTQQEAGAEKYLRSITNQYGEGVLKFIPPKEFFYDKNGVFQPVEWYTKALRGVNAYKPIYEAEQKARQVGVQVSELQKLKQQTGIDDPAMQAHLITGNVNAAANRFGDVVDDSKKQAYRETRDSISDSFEKDRIGLQKKAANLAQSRFDATNFKDIQNMLIDISEANQKADADYLNYAEQMTGKTGTDAIKEFEKKNPIEKERYKNHKKFLLDVFKEAQDRKREVEKNQRSFSTPKPNSSQAPKQNQPSGSDNTLFNTAVLAKENISVEEAQSTFKQREEDFALVMSALPQEIIANPKMVENVRTAIAAGDPVIEILQNADTKTNYHKGKSPTNQLFNSSENRQQTTEGKKNNPVANSLNDLRSNIKKDTEAAAKEMKRFGNVFMRSLGFGD